jgi:hypothetical protein
MKTRLVLVWLLGASFAAPASAGRGLATEHVVAAARGCGMKGVTIQAAGRGKFYVEWAPGTTTVTFSRGPPSARQAQDDKAFVEANLRRWDCLVRWGRKWRLKIEWGVPDLIIYD